MSNHDPRSRVADEVFERIDADHNGVIDRDEFVKAIETTQTVNALVNEDLRTHEGSHARPLGSGQFLRRDPPPSTIEESLYLESKHMGIASYDPTSSATYSSSPNKGRMPTFYQEQLDALTAMLTVEKEMELSQLRNKYELEIEQLRSENQRLTGSFLASQFSESVSRSLEEEEEENRFKNAQVDPVVVVEHVVLKQKLEKHMRRQKTMLNMLDKANETISKLKEAALTEERKYSRAMATLQDKNRDILEKLESERMERATKVKEIQTEFRELVEAAYKKGEAKGVEDTLKLLETEQTSLGKERGKQIKLSAEFQARTIELDKLKHRAMLKEAQLEAKERAIEQLSDITESQMEKGIELESKFSAAQTSLALLQSSLRRSNGRNLGRILQYCLFKQIRLRFTCWKNAAFVRHRDRSDRYLSTLSKLQTISRRVPYTLF